MIGMLQSFTLRSRSLDFDSNSRDTLHLPLCNSKGTRPKSSYYILLLRGNSESFISGKAKVVGQDEADLQGVSQYYG